MKIENLYPCHSSKAKSPIEVSIESSLQSNNTTFSTSHRVYHTRESLFSAGDPFEGLYILRSGSAKSFIVSEDGEEHVTKFIYPGDLLGIDGFNEHMHVQNVHFLETSSVWLVKESDLNDLISNSDDFRNCLLQSISHSAVCDSSMMMCLSSCSSEQKLARFILDLSAQFIKLGCSGSEFRLSMTRTDIANYLGMALETVSRVLTIFQSRQIICISNRHLTILDLIALNHYIKKNTCVTTAPSTSRPKRLIGAVH